MENIWNAILNLKEAVKAFHQPIRACWVHGDTGIVHINKVPTDTQRTICIFCNTENPINQSEITTFVLTEVGNVSQTSRGDINSEELLFLKK